MMIEFPEAKKKDFEKAERNMHLAKSLQERQSNVPAKATKPQMRPDHQHWHDEASPPSQDARTYSNSKAGTSTSGGNLHSKEQGEGAAQQPTYSENSSVSACVNVNNESTSTHQTTVLADHDESPRKVAKPSEPRSSESSKSQESSKDLSRSANTAPNHGAKGSGKGEAKPNDSYSSSSSSPKPTKEL